MKYRNKNFNNENELLVDTSIFFDYLFENTRLFAQLLLDEAGTIIKVSEGMKIFYGYDTIDLLDKNFSIIFREEDRINGKPEEELRKALETGTSAGTNYIVHKNGSLVWSHGETASLKSRHGETYYIKTVQNVDQQKILEDFLIESEQRQRLLSKMFDSFVSGIEVFKSIRNKDNEITDFQYVLINKAAETVMRKSRQDVVGKGILQEYPELMKAGLFDLWKKVVETGKSKEREFHFNAQGINTWFKSVFAKFGDGLLVTFEDITAQKTTNEELVKTTTFLYDSQELSHVCNFEWDIVKDKITGTPELYHLFGIKQEAALQDFLKMVCEEDRERVQSAFTEALKFRKLYEIEFKINVPDGSQKSVIEKARMIFDENDKVVKMIGTVADITNIKSAEEKLNQIHYDQDEKMNERTEELVAVNKHLMKIIEELDKYAYIISHDLRSPLNSVEGLIFLLGEDYKDKPLDTKGEAMLNMMNTKIQNMKELINQVLMSAKEEKKLKVPISVYEVVQEVIRTLNVPSHFHILVAGNLPVVKYTKISLIQIFQNLISNSIKYMDKERPVISITSAEHEKEYEIRVHDNGSGISEGKVDSIFNIFEVAHKNEGIDSHGLGLSIVKKLVEENGGSIRVDSKEGIGSNFYFTLPKE